jgi:hypothetical protein
VYFRDAESIFEDVDGGIDVTSSWYPRQAEIAKDHSLLRVIYGGRRASKSTLAAGEMLMLADQFPGLVIPYCCYTVSNGLDILMPVIRQYNTDHNLKLYEHLSDRKVFTPNGGAIQFYGLSTKAEVEKGRGLKSPALWVDECGKISQTLLPRAVNETFGPSTVDFQGIGGRGITLMGNPDYVPGSYWNKMCGANTGVSDFGASVHHLTIFDNPFFAGREEAIIDEYCRQNGAKRSDSRVQREWYGRFCIDSDGLAYPSWKGIVHPMHLMPVGGYTTLGVDLGSDHPCAWVVIRWVLTEHINTLENKARYIHHGHVLETYEESGLQVPDVVAITREFQQAYGVSTTHGDSGGGGKMTIDTLAGTYGLDIQPVTKSNHKQDRIWMLDGMLANGTLHVHERCQTLAEQLASVPKERKPNGLFDHMSGYADHSLDAAHYAILAARQHLQEYDLGPRIGSREFKDAQVKRAAQNVKKASGLRGELLQRLASRRRSSRSG